MSLQESDIDKLASLARLSVAPEERARLAQDIDAILGYVSELESAEAGGEVRTKDDLRNITRPDAVTHESGVHTETLVSAPARSEGGYVQVKKVL